MMNKLRIALTRTENRPSLFSVRLECAQPHIVSQVSSNSS